MRIAQHLIVIEADTKGQDSAGSGHDWHGQAGLHGKVIDVPGTGTTDVLGMIAIDALDPRNIAVGHTNDWPVAVAGIACVSSPRF